MIEGTLHVTQTNQAFGLRSEKRKKGEYGLWSGVI